jgi:hypothetical protein
MKRPFRLTLLALILILAAVVNGLRLGEAIFFWKTLKEYNTNPLYIAISGGVWLLAAFILALGLWQGKAWAWAGAICGVIGYGCWVWFDRLVLQIHHINWPFALVFTVLLSGLFAALLFSPKTRAYFKKQEASQE